MLPTADFYGTPVTRLIYGDNPINGHSYVEEKVSGEEMLDYYTADRVIETLFQCEEAGVNTYMALANTFIMRVLRQYRREGGKMNIMFQTFPAMDLDANLTHMMACEPIAIYHQGGTLDYMMECGQADLVRSRIQKIKDRGVITGMGSHDPETLLRAEEEGWGCDFYMACLYNARKGQRGQQSGFITGKKKGITLYPDDRWIMFDAIRKVKKPVIAFKILAGGQRIMNLPEDRKEAEIELAFTEAFENIKPVDYTLIGTFQKNSNEIGQDAAIVDRVLGKLAGKKEP